MTKRKSGWALILALISVISVACIKHKADPNLIQVAMISDPDGIRTMNEQLTKFTKRSGIKASATYIPWNEYSTKIINQLAAGVAPDVLWVEAGFYVHLQKAGILEPLDELIKKDKKEPLNIKDYYPGVMARFSTDNKVWAIPSDTAPIACLFYNKKMFKDAGLAFPTENWTWSDLLNAAKKLTKRDDKGVTSVWGYRDNYGPDWANIIYSNGGTLVDDWRKPTRCTLDQPAAVEAVQFLSDMINVYKVMPSSAAQENVGSAGEDMFTTGKLAMFRSGYWPSKKLREAKGIDWDIAPFPKGPRAKAHAWGTGGSGWAMCRGAKDKEKAFQVIKFLTSAENQTLYCAMGYSQPALIKLANSDVFLKQSPPAGKKFLLQAPNVAIYTPAISEWDEAQSSMISPKIDLVMLGQSKAKPVMEEISKAVNAKFFSK